MSTVDHGALDLRRKAQIAFGKAQDHAPEVVVAALPDFDLDKTIFTTGAWQSRHQDSKLPQSVQRIRVVSTASKLQHAV